MAKRFGGNFGGISGLAGVLRDQQKRAALEADLIALGLRLRDFPGERCTWHDLAVIVKHSRADSHLFAAMFPERAGWTLDALLAGRAVDLLALLLWSKTKAARHGYGRPKSILPFNKSREARPRVKAAPLSQVKARLAALHAPRRGAARHVESEQERAQRIKDLFKGD